MAPVLPVLVALVYRVGVGVGVGVVVGMVPMLVILMYRGRPIVVGRRHDEKQSTVSLCTDPPPGLAPIKLSRPPQRQMSNRGRRGVTAVGISVSWDDGEG